MVDALTDNKYATCHDIIITNHYDAYNNSIGYYQLL